MRPHPHFDDGGSFDWHTSLEEALSQARSERKLILIEYGREQCSQCRTLVQGTLLRPEIAPLLHEHYVLLGADCDAGEDDIEELAIKLEDAMELPFVLFVSPEGQFLGGLSGAIEGASLERTLQRLIESHLSPAPAASGDAPAVADERGTEAQASA